MPVPYSLDDARAFVCATVAGGVGARAGSGPSRSRPRRRAGGGTPAPSRCATRATAGAEIAYGSHPWVRGRGLMERAVQLLLDWGFAEQRLQTVIWWADQGNWASRRLAWRLGFTHRRHRPAVAAAAGRAARRLGRRAAGR